MIFAAVLLVAQTDAALGADAGYRGRAFADSWVPVVARVQTGDAPFEGAMEVRVRLWTGEVETYRRRLALAPRSDRRVPMEFFARGEENAVDVELRDRTGRTVSKLPLPLAFTDNAVRQGLVMGSAPRSLKELPPGFQTRILGASPDAFPHTYAPLLAFDAIVLAEPGELALAQHDALRRWVDLGGRLVVCGGARAHELASAELGDLLPVALAGTTVLELGDAQKLVVSQFRMRDGTEFLPVAGKSMGVRARRGRGEVVFLAFDLGDAIQPVEGEFLWRTILGVERDQARGPVMASTEHLIAGLHQAVGSFSAMALLAGVITAAVYLLAIGPVDYVLARRRRAFATAWLRLVGYIACCSGLLLGLRAQFFAPSTLATHLVLEDHGETWSHVQSWSLLQANASRVFEVRAGAGTALAPIGTGMSQRVMEEAFAAVHDEGVLKLAMPAYTTRTFSSVGRGEARVRCRRDASGALVIENDGGAALRDGLLVTDTFVYEIGEVAAGERRTVDPASAPAHAFNDWAKKLWEKQDSAWGQRAYVPLGGVPYQLSFHERIQAWRDPAGARPEWQSRRPRQRGIDLSAFVARGDAVFVARRDGNAAGLEIDAGGRTDTLTLVRVVVKR